LSFVVPEGRVGRIDRSIQEVTSRFHVSLYARHLRPVNGYRWAVDHAAGTGR
jgi:hypothetical protein